MAGNRRPPTLRRDGKYYVVGIYKPNGQRTNISFGTKGMRTEGEIYAAFGKWLDLYNQHPLKVLSFTSPYDAIEQIINPVNVVNVGELLDKYEAYIKKIKRPVRHGLEHPDLRFIRRARQFLEPYHEWPIDTFGPDELQDVQQALVKHEYMTGKTKKRYARRGINDTIKWIRKIWRWGMGRQMIRAETVQGLEEVTSLKMGTTEALDNHRRRRVTEEEFLCVVSAVNTTVGDILRLIWNTGMRPYEVCEMRPFDIICDDPDCWLYIPGRDQTPVGKHKTTRYERVKVIPLTAESQKILSRRIKDFNSKDYLFKPEDAMEEVLQKRRTNRKTPLNHGNRPGTNKKEHPMIKPSDHYTSDSLCHACKRGCKRAGVQTFVPYDLRRTMATGTRSMLGKEAAKVLLGHTKTDTTDIYLLEEVQEAMKVAKLLASNM